MTNEQIQTEAPEQFKELFEAALAAARSALARARGADTTHDASIIE